MNIEERKAYNKAHMELFKKNNPEYFKNYMRTYSKNKREELKEAKKKLEEYEAKLAGLEKI